MTTTTAPADLTSTHTTRSGPRGWKTGLLLVTGALAISTAIHTGPLDLTPFQDCTQAASPGPDTSLTVEGLNGGADPKAAEVTTRVWSQDPISCTWHEAPGPGRG